MPSTDDYLSLVPDYNASQPNFMAALTTVLTPLTSLQAFLATMPDQFDLDVAIGTQLDQVGIWIGRDRFVQTPITGVYFSWDIDGLGWEQGFWQGAFDPDDGVSRLDDETYRQLLYAKAMSNVWDSSPAAINDMINKLLENEGVTALVIDNQNMTMNVNVQGVLENLIFKAVLEGGYLPVKPVGVQLTWLIPDATNGTGNTSALIQAVFGIQLRATVLQQGKMTIAPKFTPSIDAPAGGNATLSFNPRGNVSLVTNILAAGRFNQISTAGGVVLRGTHTPQGRSTIGATGGVTLNATVLSASTQHFSTSQKNFWMSLSNSNYTVTKTGNDGVYSAVGPFRFVTSGKWYFEMHIDALSGDILVGIGNPSMPVTDDSYVGIDANGYADSPAGDGTGNDIWNNALQHAAGVMPNVAVGSVMRFAIDANGWFSYIAADSGPWNGTVGADPVAGTGGWPIPSSLQTGGVGPAVALAFSSNAVTGRFQSSDWSFTAPTGYGAM